MSKELAQRSTEHLFKITTQNPEKRFYFNYEGYRFFLEKSDYCLCISDIDLYRQTMQVYASRSEGYLNFILKTRTYPDLKPHPLMHASLFKKLSIDHFSKQFEVNYLTSKFQEGSVNYQQFYDAYNVSKDKLIAIKNTWTAKSNQELGFRPRSSNDVKFERNRVTKNLYDVNSNYWKI